MRHTAGSPVGRGLDCTILVRPDPINMLYFSCTEGLRGTDRTDLSMAARGHSKTARQRQAPPRPGLAVAVFHHAGSDVEVHLARLARQRRYRFARYSQSALQSTETGPPPAAVLWELGPGRRPNWRRLRAVAQGAPILSYSSSSETTVLERSRGYGFSQHLAAPVSPVDLATRWRRAGGALARYLDRVETYTELTRRVGRD